MSISEAAAIIADPASSVGFPSGQFNTDVRDDSGGSNIVAFGRSKTGDLSLAEGAALLANNESGRSRKTPVRDRGGRLSISQAAQLLAHKQPKYEGKRLSISQGVDMLLGKPLRPEQGELTTREGVDLLVASSPENVGRAEAALVELDYVIESQNASMALASANADIENLYRKFEHFCAGALNAFTDVALDANAVMRMSPERLAQFRYTEEKFERFKDSARASFAQRDQAWNHAIRVENREFLAQNPDFQPGDADAMSAILLAVVGLEEATALVTTPMTVSASDPRVHDVLRLAAGSDDADSIMETLRGAGFTDADIGAIGNGTARCHLLDHRVKAIVLRASRNVEISDE
ncbi:hypothetical protein NKH85_16300 [Mesorhizobium sp. M0924]|uniref:hypothetical protein n=1 Tax=unclassified Mesorhizobium TaxID=325217 RepID=UPI0033359B14